MDDNARLPNTYQSVSNVSCDGYLPARVPLHIRLLLTETRSWPRKAYVDQDYVQMARRFRLLALRIKSHFLSLHDHFSSFKNLVLPFLPA